jgi:peroxiredoxin
VIALLAASPLPAQKLPRPDPSPGRRVGDLAHDFTLKDLDGRSHRLKDLRGRRVVHVVFWATWCVPCVQEIPILRETYAAYRDRGLEILSVVISTNQTPDMVRTLSRHFKVNYPILFDANDVVRGKYRIDAIPQNFLVGKDGIIRYAGTHLPADYQGLLETLLAESAPTPAGGQATASH